MNIKSKFELKQILEEEKAYYKDQLGVPLIDWFFARPGRKIFNYLRHLRYMEYYRDKGFLGKIAYYYHYFFYIRLSYKLGYQIPCGTCGRGLRLCHMGGV